MSAHTTHGGPAAVTMLDGILSGRRTFASTRDREMYLAGVLLSLVPPEAREAAERVYRMPPIVWGR